LHECILADQISRDGQCPQYSPFFEFFTNSTYFLIPPYAQEQDKGFPDAGLMIVPICQFLMFIRIRSIPISQEKGKSSHPAGKNNFVVPECRRYAMSIIDLSAPYTTEKSNTWAFRLWEITKTAEERLRHSGYLELRNVSCDIHEGVLTLRGRVPSYHLKQLAQAILREIEGVLEMNNQLDVVAPGDIGQSNCGPNNFDHPPRRYV
jgi:hypothetical protein